jgi:hypothetical protein
MVQYDLISNLPILYTALGISTFTRYCAHQGIINSKPSDSDATFLNYQYRNLTPKQLQKLHLHEHCTHVHWDQLSSWIRSGALPCDKMLATVPDPVCATCQFSKAHKRSHKMDPGHIAWHHTASGEGVSSDGMEARFPGRMMTMGGVPMNCRYHYSSFWVDHFSQFVYVLCMKQMCWRFCQIKDGIWRVCCSCWC